jgi:ubiquitin carboxyl-terminal hydrolase 9/13
MNFPTRTPLETLKLSSSAPSSDVDQSSSNLLSPLKSKAMLSNPNSPLPKAKPATPGVPPTAQLKEENKDSPEYKKKQALAAGPLINMDYENSHNYHMKESLFSSLKDIFEAVIAHDSRIGVVSPHKFLEILRRDNEMFRTPMHQDAHEFLNLLLNEVVENVQQYAKQVEANPHSSGSDSGSKSDSASTGRSAEWMPNKKIAPPNTRWVHELFEGTLTSETRCLTCENVSQRDEAFLDLSVDLEQHSSVTSCLRKFSEEEMLCERNKFHCDKCGGLQEAEKRMKIKRLPKILALHLKRFKYTEDLQRLQKLFHRVVYPYYLRLFNTTDDTEDPDRLYELYAVVVHIGGGPYHGHYVSIVKTQDRGWLLFDDENVEPVDKSFVRNYFGGEQSLACAYVLFYQETTFEAMQREQEAESKVAMAYANTVANKDPVKANGAIIASGLGILPPSPIVESHDFANLNHAVTMPFLSPMVTSAASTNPFQSPLESVVSSPMLPFLGRKKSNVHGKRDFEREEKEKRAVDKAAEKEAERLAKIRKKEATALQKRNSRKDAAPREDESPVARTSFSTGSRTSQTLDELARHHGTAQEEYRPSSGHEAKENGAGGFLGGSLSRFRQTSMSMSMKSKPKFWGSSKNKPEQPPPLIISSPIMQRPAPILQEYSAQTQPPAPPPPVPPKPQYDHFLHQYDTSSLPLPPTPGHGTTLGHSNSSPQYTPPTSDAAYFLPPPPGVPAAGSITPTPQREMLRSSDPTALPYFDTTTNGKSKKEKEKKSSRFHIGKKKSLAGFL